MRTPILRYLANLLSGAILAGLYSTAFGIPLQLDSTTTDSLNTQQLLSSPLLEESQRVIEVTDPAKAKHAMISGFRRKGDIALLQSYGSAVGEALPNDAEVQAYLALSTALSGKPLQASNLLKKLPKTSATEFPRVLTQALIARDRGNVSQARTLANKAIKLDSQAVYPHLLLGSLAISQKQYARARNHLSQAIKLYPSYAAAYSNMGASYLLEGNNEEARKQYDKAIAIAPAYCAPLLGSASIAMANSAFQSAISDLRACLSSDPGNLTARRYLLASYIQSGQLDQAAAEADSLKKTNPRLASSVLVDIAMKRGDYEKVISDLKHTDDTADLLSLMFAQLATKKIAEAEKTIQKLQQQEQSLLVDALDASVQFYKGVNPENSLLNQLERDKALSKLGYFLAAMTAASQQKSAQAEKDLRASSGLISGFELSKVSSQAIAKSLDSQSPRYLLMGTILNLKDLHKGAAQYLAKASQENPDNFIAYYLSGVAAKSNHQPAAAEQALTKTVSLAPDFFSGQFLLAESLVQQGKLKEARNAYDAASKLQDHAGVLIRLGILNERLGDDAGAESAYQRLATAFPDNFIGFNQLAWFYAQRGEQLPKAKQLAMRADELNPGNTSINDTLGWIAYQLEQYDDAERYLEKANTASKGQRPDVLYHLAVVLNKQGNTGKAKQVIEQALALGVPFDDIQEARRMLGELQ